MIFPKVNLYQKLKLPDFCPIEKVKERYRWLALKLHPDRGGRLKDMQILNSFYDILSKHKEEYDNFLKQLQNPYPAVKINIWTNRGYTTTTTATYY